MIWQRHHDIEQTKNSRYHDIEQTKVQSYDSLKLAFDAKFCLLYHFRPNVCDIDENIQIEIIIYPQREGRFSKNFVYFTDAYLLS